MPDYSMIASYNKVKPRKKRVFDEKLPEKERQRILDKYSKKSGSK